MVVDLDQYKANKKLVQQWYLDHKDREIKNMITNLSVSTYCPVIVIAFYVGEVAGWPQDVLDLINKLILFYKYTEIRNKPENSPI